ncbi:glycerate kinase [Candidatus Bathyarchaeota archaeon]|nr:MAG: glycerate kinase [Candidatus Bathyarchaeota archaeon]
MVQVENKKELLKNAFSGSSRKAREVAIDVIEASLKAVDPREVIKAKINLSNATLNVDGRTFNLRLFEKIIVVGGGKAGGPMAEALEETLGDRIEEGLIVVPKGTASQYHTKRIRFHEASHPIPDRSSLEGAQKIMDLASNAEENSLVICLISGGGSSLMTLPKAGVSLSDMQKMTDLLLRCGATIREINTVRKHVSAFKGGQLAKAAYPATLLCLLLSDVLGDPLDVIASGPTVPDTTSYDDAVNVLKRHNIWDKAPQSIRRILLDGQKRLVEETPKPDDPAFTKVHNVVVGNNRLACEAARNKLKEEGLNVLYLTSLLEGEAREVGIALSSIAKEILASGNPAPPPAGIIAGGETTVTVEGSGKGGRNQEIALAAALKIDGIDRILVASFSTDGIDGPTDAAGAIVDGRTIVRSRNLCMDAREYLGNNDSYTFFEKLGDLIHTGPTGTNVNDITLMIVL